MLPDALIQQLAQRLNAAASRRAPIAPLTDDYPDLGTADAYRIQARLVEQALARGARIVGWKAGFTSEAMRRQMGVSEPNRGYLLDYMQLEGIVHTSQLIHPRVEPEIAFVIGADLRGPGCTPLEVLAATRGVCPALEVVDSRFRDYRFRAQDNTADNSSAARFVLGPDLTPVAGLDLAALAVTLERNGKVIERGDGAAAMGNPASAVAWIVNQLAETGLSMRAGDVIISGGLTSAPYLTAGDRFTARIEGLGSVHLRAG